MQQSEITGVHEIGCISSWIHHSCAVAQGVPSRPLVLADSIADTCQASDSDAQQTQTELSRQDALVSAWIHDNIDTSWI